MERQLLKLVNDRESCNHGRDCLECSGWPDLDGEES